MLKNLSIKVRLIFVVSFLSVLLALFGTVGLVSLQLTNSGLRSLYEDRLVALGQLSQVTSAASAGRYAIATAIVGSGEDMDKYLELLSRTLADGDKVWAEYLQTYLTPEETQLAQQFDTDYKKFIAEGVKPAMAALHNRDFQGATNLYNGPLLKLFRELNVSMNKLTALQQNVGKQLYQESQARYQTFLVITIAAIAIGLSVALIMGIWLVRAISGPLNLAVKVARGVADGDLTQVIEVHSHDEAGQLMEALRTMNGRLQQIVGEVRVSTDTISTASAEIASGNMDLSSRTESQAGSLEETASAMEELTSTVKQNADNARQANQLAASASEIAIEGGNVVGKVVETMNNINDSSKKIVDIISVIDGIAFQTNILALNAAVEAARAGEQGRGFAVVASEVRSLAQRSAAAAKEIKTLIDDSVQKVSEGSKLVEQAGVTMDGVVLSVKRVTDVMGEITAASQEQSSGIEEVNRAITQMDETTQQNAALVEQAAAAAQSLQDQAQRLTHAVSVFKLDGKRATVSVPAAPAKKATVAAAPAAVAAVTTAVAKPAAPAVRKTVVAKPVKPVVKPAASPASAAVKPSEDDWEQF